ncbi:septation ring formation regulator EzrA [Ligilactobacillus ceti]|uniref:Septation ring formation regulator EzrA n=1 Tax=Ligilactobacillus ceti DSM 22408 TaxID=1122146 RepID=A0A0R2KI41_9LACO|nr:septation ring formation regulator EzrA [Ligilactobacillus ceti]KRN88984.1 septation ring formation regulator EzrA [Ligilactobacillus ceti DSM 22408]
MNMLYFFIAIILIVVGIYLALMYFQHTYKKVLIEQQKQVTAVLENSLEGTFADLNKLNLTGDSLTELEKLEKSYRYLMNRQLPEISEFILALHKKLTQFKVFGFKRELSILNRDLEGAQSTYADIKQRLDLIIEDTKAQQAVVAELKDKYQDIRKQLLAKNESYGPALDELENRLTQLEYDFDQYVEITLSGDYVKAQQPMQQLEEQTAQMEVALTIIPELQHKLVSVFPIQLAELKAGVEQLTSEYYGFTQDLLATIADIETKCQVNHEQIKTLDVEQAQELNQQIVIDIDGVYDAVEKEYVARQVVESNEKQLNEFIEHAQKQEQNLLVELDRLQQNYTLSHQELEKAHKLEQEIKIIEKQYLKFHERTEDAVFVYSILKAEQEEMFANLKQIEETQKNISDSVADLWQEEKDAQARIQNFDIEIHRMQRDIEKLNLPGLTEEYMDYFYKVSREITTLEEDLNHVKIDMDQITKDLINTQSDLDFLGDKTKEIIDSSILAEELMQYSNRYRTRHPEVAKAYNTALELFNRKYDYVAALDTISQAVDAVEPGAFDRIAQNYEEREQTRYPLN